SRHRRRNARPRPVGVAPGRPCKPRIGDRANCPLVGREDPDGEGVGGEEAVTKPATTSECIDCGHPCTPTLDAPLCDPCAALALTLLGSVEAREALLGGPR